MSGPRMFVDLDAEGCPCVWLRGDGEPTVVLHGGDVLDQELWNDIVRLVEETP